MIPAFVSPVVRPNLVSSGWGSDRKYRATEANPDPKHEGLDFKVAVGNDVFAVGDGKVLSSKNALPDPAGEMISIQHEGGIISRYMHLSQRLVQKGDLVRAGQLIARSGSSGIKSSAAHLHFDFKIRPADLTNYTSAFGKPTTGFFGERFGLVGVPAEPLVPVDRWAPGVKEAAARNNIPLYTAVGGGLLFYAVVAGLVYYYTR